MTCSSAVMADPITESAKMSVPTTTSDSTSLSMGPSMPRRRERHDYGRPGSVTPERWLAHRLGRSPAGVHQLLYAPFRCGLTLPDLAAICITSFIETGADDRLTRWAAPVRAAFARIQALPLSREMICEVQRLDLLEDIAESEYLANPSAELAKRWVALIDRCVRSLLALRAALVAKHKLEEDR